MPKCASIEAFVHTLHACMAASMHVRGGEPFQVYLLMGIVRESLQGSTLCCGTSNALCCSLVLCCRTGCRSTAAPQLQRRAVQQAAATATTSSEVLLLETYSSKEKQRVLPKDRGKEDLL